MEECSGCGQKAKLVWNVEGNSYCKKCHPVTERLISVLDGQAVNRSRLPKDLHRYFSGDYVTPALLSENERVCGRCKQKARHYAWYHNGYPSRAYSYCTKCHRISYKLD